MRPGTGKLDRRYSFMLTLRAVKIIRAFECAGIVSWRFAMQKGTVKWFSSQKGYGFICDEEGNDIFVHFSGLNMEGYKTIDEGSEVEFEVIDGPKGPQAVNVTRL